MEPSVSGFHHGHVESQPTGSVPVVGPNEQVVLEWLRWSAEHANRSRHTMASYTATMAALLDWLGGQHLTLVDTEQLERFTLRARPRRGGRRGSPATRKREISTLCSFYKWLEGRVGGGWVAPTRVLRTPRVPMQLPKPIPDSDWLPVWRLDLCDSDRVMLGLGYGCGLRRQEIVSLSGRQITPTRIVSFIRKGGGEDSLQWAAMVDTYDQKLPHLLPDSQQFHDAMGRLRRRDAGSLLAWSTTNVDAANKRVKRLCERADVRPWTPHQMRHSCATNLISAGVPLPIVSRLLNHSHISITMRYVRAGGDELRQWLRGQYG